MYHFTLNLCGYPLNWLTDLTDGIESYKSEGICDWLYSQWSHYTVLLEACVLRDKLFERKGQLVVFYPLFFSEINTLAPHSVRLAIDPSPPPPPPVVLLSWLRVWKAHCTFVSSSRTCSAFPCSAVWKSQLQYKDIIANAARALASLWYVRFFLACQGHLFHFSTTGCGYHLFWVAARECRKSDESCYNNLQWNVCVRVVPRRRQTLTHRLSAFS